jgi:hypothetical protein
MRKSKKFYDLLGKRFDRLLVIEKCSKDIYGKIFWLCKCNCGNYVKIITSHLISGHTRSCGCLRKDLMSLRFGEGSLNKYYNQYRNMSKRRGLYFELTKEQFSLIVYENCTYCGAIPKIKNYYKNTYNGSFAFNGIDRVNNTLGYSVDNCVPCCTTCNRAKLQMTKQEFIDWITRVYNYSVNI